MTKLTDYEWQFLIQLTTKIHTAQNAQILFQVLNDNLSLIVDFDVAMCMNLIMEAGTPKITDFFQISRDNIPNITSAEDERSPWLKFVVQNTQIFRQSDFISGTEWEHSYSYLKIWKPYNLYYGLFVCIVRDGTPLCVYGFLRSKPKGDFNEKDSYILSMLTTALEARLPLILSSALTQKIHLSRHLKDSLERYDFTPREHEIVKMICHQTSSVDICQKLCISTSTLNKHLSNIYKKTSVKNRVQLFALFNTYI